MPPQIHINLKFKILIDQFKKKKKRIKNKKTHEFRSNILFIKNTEEHNTEKIIKTQKIKHKEHKKI